MRDAADEDVQSLKLLRVREVADLLGISRQQVYNLIARDEIPALHIASSVRVPVRALRKWLASQPSGGWNPRKGL